MNMEHQPKPPVNQPPVSAGKSCHRRLFDSLMICTLLAAVLGGIMLTGCCKMIPFRKCRPNTVLSIHYTTNTDSNNGKPVQVRFLLLENQAAFEKCSPRVVFKDKENQASYDGLAVPKGLLPFDLFLSPGDTGTDLWSIPDDKIRGEAPLFLGIIANFAQAATDDSGRKVVALERRRIPRAINVLVGQNYLQIVTDK